MDLKLHVVDSTFIFMLRMPIFDHELGAKKKWVLFVVCVSATLNLVPKTCHDIAGDRSVLTKVT